MALTPVWHAFRSRGHLLRSLQSAQPSSAARLIPEKRNVYFRDSVASGPEVYLRLLHQDPPRDEVATHGVSSVWSMF